MSAEKFNFDQVVESIRQDVPNEETVRAAGERVWERMTSLEKTTEIHAPDRLRTCADFRAVFPSYLNGTLSDARRMLVEDHTHSCPECRRELDRARGEKAVVIPFARKQKPVIRWAMAAAAGVALLAVIPFAADRVMAPSGPRATVATVDGQIFRVTANGLEALTPGAAIQEKEEIRTAKASYATLKLADGSIVEMDERAELSVSSAWRGSTIKLDRGNIIVQAAKQGSKRLRVDSGDAMVTVKGTIFSVSRGAKGSRVSVVEGEVQVDQSSASQALKPGQQAATDATLTATNIADEVAWSKNSAKYMSLLGEFALIERRLSASPGPALRYSSRLAKMVPPNAVL
jgi:ferric-dicitrate binding protein FerR (iron transport regulator)